MLKFDYNNVILFLFNYIINANLRFRQLILDLLYVNWFSSYFKCAIYEIMQCNLLYLEEQVN